MTAFRLEVSNLKIVFCASMPSLLARKLCPGSAC